MAGALGIFLEQFNDWKFCPPTSHLWVLKIQLHNDGDIVGTNGEAATTHTLSALYDNICKVNKKWDDVIKSSHSVTVGGESASDLVKKYIESTENQTIGQFLVTDVSFNANQISIKDESSPNNTAYSGWLSYGKILSGRTHNHAGKIKFYRTNWDINELLFDPWIAAIGKQGLIEASEQYDIYNIKADIFIYEYANSIPVTSDKNAKTKKSEGAAEDREWKLRKTIKLTKCFPKQRKQYTYSYSPDNASKMDSVEVDIEFENYSVEYAKYDFVKRNLVDEFESRKGGKQIASTGIVKGDSKKETGSSYAKSSGAVTAKTELRNANVTNAADIKYGKA